MAAACLRLEPCRASEAEVEASCGLVEVEAARRTLEPPEAPAEPSAPAGWAAACSP